MSLTAWTTPSSVANSTTRSRSDSTGSGTGPPLRRIERVAQPVADEVDAEDDQHDRQAGEGDEPPVLGRHVLTVGDQLPERGRRRLNAEAEERECCLDENRQANDQRGVDDDRPDRIGKDVTEHDTR